MCVYEYLGIYGLKNSIQLPGVPGYMYEYVVYRQELEGLRVRARVRRAR